MPRHDAMTPALPDTEVGRAALNGCVAWRVVHETPAVQLIDWRCRHDDDPMRVERCHTSWVVSVVRRGACRVHDGSWSAQIDPTVAVLNRPGFGYRTTHPFGCNDAGWSFALSAELADDLLARAPASVRAADRPSITVATRPARDALATFVAFRRRTDGHPVDPLEVDEQCLALFEALLDPDRAGGSTRGATGPVHRRLAERAAEHLAAGLPGVPSLPGIAADLEVSASHLCRVFRRHTGLSMSAYVKRLRVSAALDLVAGGGGDLTGVALDVGFYSHSHLTTAFREVYGVPPRDVRSRLSG